MDVNEQDWLSQHLGIGSDTPDWAQIPNPLFNPCNRDGFCEQHPHSSDSRFQPAAGLLNYLEDVRSNLSRAVDDYADSASHNLPADQLMELKSLRDRTDVMVVNSDKTLGPVVDFTARYQRLLQFELDQCYEPAEAYFRRYNLIFSGESVDEQERPALASNLRLPNWSSMWRRGCGHLSAPTVMVPRSGISEEIYCTVPTVHRRYLLCLAREVT